MEKETTAELDRINTLIFALSQGKTITGVAHKGTRRDRNRVYLALDDVKAISARPNFNGKGEHVGFKTLISYLTVGFGTESTDNPHHLTFITNAKHGMHKKHIVLTGDQGEHTLELSPAEDDPVADRWDEYVQEHLEDHQEKRDTARKAALRLVEGDQEASEGP